MSEKFQKGQLVAVRYGSSWEPRIFLRKDDDGLWCMDFLSHGASPYAQEDVEPAEAVWPEIFLGWERRAGEQAAGAVAMESALVQRLRRQIAWLCQELNQINSGSDETCHCPDPELRFSPKPMDCHPEGCTSCWRDACRKAVKEEPCP